MKRRNSNIDPAFLSKEKEALRRKHRKSVLFNSRELAMMEEYCKRFKIKSKSGLIREAVMQEILKGMGENHPSLFE